MYTTLFFVAGLLGLAQAQSYTPPGAQTFGSLYTPDVSHPVTQGQTFKVTWDPKGHTTDGSTVSLVLCKGGSGNCVNAPTAIASGIPAVNAQYDWAVPCSLAPGVQSTDSGYGMLIIVDGTGEFQYSTQFSVLAGSSCGSSSSSTTSMKSSTTTPKTTYTTTADASSSWTAWAGYNTTTSHTTSHYISTTQKPTVPATQTVPMITTIKVSTTTPAAIASASVFKGAASQFGASAAALVLAAGAAVLAL